MGNQTQATLEGKDTLNTGVLHLAMEMGEAKWKLAFSDGRVKAGVSLRTPTSVSSNLIQEAL